jgi:hypothetical protein
VGKDTAHRLKYTLRNVEGAAIRDFCGGMDVDRKRVV